MTGLTPTDIFPLNYPKGDTTIPEKGAKAVPFILDWSKDNNYTANLLQVRDQKFFGSLRCLWIDASLCTQNFTVAVNGTEQIFTVIAGTSAYYPVINLNVPVVTFSMTLLESSLARIICLNFVPAISAPLKFPSGIQPISGTVAVSNLPATQNVDVLNFPATQPVSGTVAVGNFPATQNVDVLNFPATQPVSGTVSVFNFPATQNVVSISGAHTSTIVVTAIPASLVNSALNLTFLRSVSIFFNGATVLPGTTISIYDQSGALVFNQIIAATTNYTGIFVQILNLARPLALGPNNTMAQLSANPSSGTIYLNITAD